MRRLPRGGRVLMACAAMTLGVLGACGDDEATDDGSQPSSGESTPAAPDALVSIVNTSFSVNGDATAGTAFVVANDDGVTHTFTDTGGAFDVTVDGGSTADVTVTEPGTYEVICKIHGSMRATLTVS